MHACKGVCCNSKEAYWLAGRTITPSSCGSWILPPCENHSCWSTPPRLKPVLWAAQSPCPPPLLQPPEPTPLHPPLYPLLKFGQRSSSPNAQFLATRLLWMDTWWEHRELFRHTIANYSLVKWWMIVCEQLPQHASMAILLWRDVDTYHPEKKNGKKNNKHSICFSSPHKYI